MAIEHDLEKGFNDISTWASDNEAALGVARQALEDPPNTRLGQGLSNRNQQVMTWRLPNGSTVQMYINPENFVVAESKQINHTRTKGGFVVQYWGDNLTKLTLSGTTGSSGVKGIQVLRDIYRAENSAFEVMAASQENDIAEVVSDAKSNSDIGLDTMFYALAQQSRENNFLLRPSLASLALSVSLFYQGISYRGYFTEFTVTENVQNLGLFDYQISFMVTETRGSRQNFMAWHKEPLASDTVGQLITGTMNAIGNSMRSLAGLPGQAQNPQQFHPENAPRSFGGSTSLSAALGITPGSSTISR
jgi:hypothetical protein